MVESSSKLVDDMKGLPSNVGFNYVMWKIDGHHLNRLTRDGREKKILEKTQSEGIPVLYL